MDLSKPIPRQSLVNTVALAIQTRIPVLLIGRPGSGKSATIRAITQEALKWKFYCHAVPGKRDPAQVQGLPQLKDGFVQWAPYRHLVELAEAQDSVFMLDDVAEASMDMQAYYLGIVHDRDFGGLVLKNTSMVAAANPVQGKLRLSAALCNRVLHLPWNISTTEFAVLMREGFPTPEIPRIDPEWQSKYLPGRRAQISAFLESTSDFLIPDVETNTAVEEIEAHPSQRSWENTARLLAGYDAATFENAPLADQQVLKLVLYGEVGQIAGDAFFAWFAEKDLPLPTETLADPHAAFKKVDALGKRPDRLWLILSVMTRYVMLHNEKEFWKQAWKVLGVLAETKFKSYGVNAARVLNQHRPKGISEDPAELVHYASVLSSSVAV